jgi:hypothetical protein
MPFGRPVGKASLHNGGGGEICHFNTKNTKTAKITKGQSAMLWASVRARSARRSVLPNTQTTIPVVLLAVFVFLVSKQRR